MGKRITRDSRNNQPTPTTGQLNKNNIARFIDADGVRQYTADKAILYG